MMRGPLSFCFSKLQQLLAIVIVGLAAFICAHADTIVITGGNARISQSPFPFVPVTLSGQNFSANVVALNGGFGLSQCHFSPCTTASLSWTSSGGDLSGSFTVNGLTFPTGIDNQLFLQFDSVTFTIPPEFFGASGINITAPFTFFGLVVSPALPQTIFLTGEGTVHLFLLHQNFGDTQNGFFLDHADYTFGPRQSALTIEPVPKPMTILLFLTGLTGTAMHVQAKRRKHD